MLEKLKLLAGEEENDALLQFSLDSAQETVLNYCHIKKLPEGLKNTVVRMAADIYRNENPTKEGEVPVVASIKEGDTTTSFADGSSDREAFNNGLLKNYRSQLNRYRRMAK